MSNPRVLGINGLGRIGKLTLWYHLDRDEFDRIVVNVGRDVGTSLESLAHYIDHDSTYGPLSRYLMGHRGRPDIRVVDEGQGLLLAYGKEIRVLRQERDPARIPWRDNDVAVVVDTTGKFADPTATADQTGGSLRGHLEAGARLVVQSSAFKSRQKDAGMPDDAVMLIKGINHYLFDPAKHVLVSGASCTTTALAHMLRPLLDRELTHHIITAGMSTVHAATNSQPLLDAVPKAGAKDLRAVLVVLQKIFKFRTCTLNIRQDDLKRRFFRPCILYSIRQCTAPCAAKIEKPQYRKIIRDLMKFLRSKRSVVLRQLRKQMAEASQALEYEKAAMFRDRIRLIEALDRRGTPDENVQPEVFAADPTEALVQLRELLQSSEPVRIIEGIDVANIAGTEAVGSLVKFIDGRPFRSGYRRFRIKTVKGIDDYAMIAEVVKRRYKYALRGEELWPDLVLIDGGLGHLRAAEHALKELNAPAVKIASIAKREEDIYLQGRNSPLKFGPHSPVRKLLQYVRDEAHRFAQHYHHILRSKKMLAND